MHDENLVKYTDMTPEEKAEFHSRGGKASTTKRRQKKTFAETLRAVLASEYPV